MLLKMSKPLLIQWMPIIATIISLTNSSCRFFEVEREFFPQSRDTVYFSSDCYWHMDICSKKRISRRGVLFRTTFNFPDRRLEVLSNVTDSSWIMCNLEGKECDKIFNFANTSINNISDVLETRLIFSSEENYIFSYRVAGGRGHAKFSDIMIWGISKSRGLICIGYYNKYFCKFEQTYGDTIFLIKNEELICQNI